MARPKNKIDLRLLTKIGKLYYEDGLNQEDIVARLHTSRSTISRLLQQAKDVGIVRVVIVPPADTFADLETRIEQKYQIEEAVVVDVQAPDSPQMIARELGAAAAEYLFRVINQNDVIGVSWGFTIRGMVAALEPKEFPNVRIVQMTGGIGKPESESHATELCIKMARTLSCKLALLPAPGVVKTKQIRDVYLKEEHVHTAMNLLPSITLAFVGIGSLNSFSISVRDETILTQDDIEEVVANGGIGDIALRFIDANGQPVQSELSERIIGIDLDHLRQIPRLVGVAAGANKIEPIRAVLSGKLIDVLITDLATAETLAKA